jgi:hypothetical protein
MSEIENILVDDEFIIIITSDGKKRTLRIDNHNPNHRSWIENILSMAISLVNETNEDVMDNTFNDNNSWQDDFGDVDDYEW